jgi:hypothetical protein
MPETEIKEKATLNVEMTKELFDQLNIEAKRLQISMADFMRIRLVEYFDKVK